MSSYYAVVLPSPILEEGLKNYGVARSRNPEESRTGIPAGESLWLSGAPCKSASLGCKTSWQVCPAGAEHTLGS